MTITEAILFIKPYADPALLELVAIGEEMSTGDGRWKALQAWLKRNRKWSKKARSWLKSTPEIAYAEIKAEIVGQSKNPLMFAALLAHFLDNDPVARQRVATAIEKLQTLYKERKAQDKPQAEIGINNEWIHDKPGPSAHKSIDDYQRQLKAKEQA